MARRSLDVPPLVLAAFVYVAALAVLIMVDADSPWLKWKEIVSEPFAEAWCAVVAGQVAIWSVLLTPISQRFGRYREMLRGRRLEAVAIGVSMLALLIMLIAGNQLHPKQFPVDSQKTKVAFITAIGFAVAFPCLLGMRFAGKAAESLTAAGNDVEVLDRFRSHLRDLDWFLSIAGIIVAGATLSTGILRNALRELNPGREWVAPITVLLYGAVCSALIAGVYIPAYRAAAHAGRGIIDALVPSADGSPAEWIEANERRAKLANLLGINATAWQRLNGGLAILAPLAGSALSFVASK